MPEYDISVIVPIYNAEQYLNQCVDSILAQTKKNIEIVLVDDGSTDRSSAIVDEYAAANDNVLVIHQVNGGVGKARVTGLQNAHGKVIGWVDADDFIAQDMYEKLYALLVERDADYVYCDYNFYPHKVRGKEKWFKLYHGCVDWDYIERNNQEWNSLTRHSLLDEIGIERLFPVFGEYAWIAVLLHAKRPAVLEEKLYFYRVGIESTSGGSYKGKTAYFRRMVNMTAQMHELIDGTPYEKSLWEYFEYRQIYTLLQLCVVAAINNDLESYRYAQETLRKKRFKTNPLLKTILDHNHGKKKSFVLRNVIPFNYQMACILTRLFYGE